MIVACHLGTALQSIVSRNISAQDTAVLSITRIQSGDAYNVIPQHAVLAGTARTMKAEVMAMVEQNMKRLAVSIAEGFGAEAVVDFRTLFAPVENNAEEVFVLRRRGGGGGWRGERAAGRAAIDGIRGFRLHDARGAGRSCHVWQWRKCLGAQSDVRFQ